MRRLLGAIIVVLVVALGAPAVARAESGWSPPVDAPVVDRFRPPASQYGAGNRGMDFATTPGEPVRAAVDGTVVFAGQVGSSLHVVVLLDNGLRTTYSFLQDITVERGAPIRRGDVIGHAGSDLHFGVRAGEHYLDPEPLLAGAPPAVHLVEPVDHTSSLFSEFAGIVASFGGRVISATADGVTWVANGVQHTAQLVVRDSELVIVSGLTMITLPLEEWRRWQRARLFEAAQRNCTPAAQPPPSRPGEGRLAVLVAGFGSSAGHAGVLDVDTDALGYAPGDVTQFSYRGGQAEWSGHGLAGVTTTTYDAADSVGPLRTAVERLRALLDDIARRSPGRTIDVIAHSQGGVVARAALEAGTAAPVAHFVALGSPFHGAPLATAARRIGSSASGAVAERILDAGGLPATSAAVRDLAEGSSFLDAMNARRLPPTVRFTSIGASGDWIVPALQVGAVGAVNAVVRIDDPRAHDELPGSAAAQREIALALGNRPPTCRDVGPDLVTSEFIAATENSIGGSLALAGANLDLDAIAAGLGG